MIRVWKTENDYPLAVQWWGGHGKSDSYVPLAEFLPRSGFVVETKEGHPLCMGWLYFYMDVPCAQLGYFVTNPQNSAVLSKLAMHELIEHVNRLADEQQLRLIARYDHTGILGLLEESGWRKLIENQTEMIRYPGGLS